jgi:predicted Fe-Mo cluster-binding NifX family protein
VKIAIPMFNTRVSPRFDFASKILVTTIDRGKVTDRETYSLINLNPIRRAGLLSDLGVNTILCGGISDFSQRLIAANAIEVIPMVQGEVEEVLDLFINNKLTTAIIPAVQGKRSKHHHGKKGKCKHTKTQEV